MAPRSKYSAEQLAFMQTYQEQFLRCKADRNYELFWAPFYEEWSKRFPEQLEVFKDIPLDQPLTPEQTMIEAEAWSLRKRTIQDLHAIKRLLEKFRNDYGGSKAGRVANSANTGAINKMLGRILKKGSGEKTTRVLKPWEMYSKTHYTAKVKDGVMAERSSQPVGKSSIHLITQRTKKAFEEESEDVRAAVFAAVEAMKERKRAEIEEVKEQSDTVSKDIYVSKIALILSQFFEELHEMTDWVFTVLMGGPDPAMGGALDVSSFHVGTTKIGNRFSQTYPNFTKGVMVPYTQFVERVFPEAMVLTRAQGSLPSTPSSSGLPRPSTPSSSTAAMTPSCTNIFSAPTPLPALNTTSSGTNVFSGPTPLPALNTASQIPLFNPEFMFKPDDNHLAAVPEAPNQYDVNFFSDFAPNPVDTDEDMELMRPLLSMPPQSSNTMSASPSLLQLLQGATMEPHLEQDLALHHGFSSPPHIGYQFENLGGMTTDHEDVSMGATLLPASASVQTAPFPALPLVPSLSGSVPEQIVIVPLPTHSPASITVVPPLTVVPPSLLSPPFLNRLHHFPGHPILCIRSNNHDAVTEGDGRLPPIENGLELEGGRGKRQRFQSKRAAAANDIGQIQASRKGKSAHMWIGPDGGNLTPTNLEHALQPSERPLAISLLTPIILAAPSLALSWTSVSLLIECLEHAWKFRPATPVNEEHSQPPWNTKTLTLSSWAPISPTEWSKLTDTPQGAAFLASICHLSSLTYVVCRDDESFSLAEEYYLPEWMHTAPLASFKSLQTVILPYPLVLPWFGSEPWFELDFWSGSPVVRSTVQVSARTGP
ncbi:hypothetical protein CY34DRAFT_17381 [Suillus luteus UH-Slu-Lm8-n1]|uniref:Unplaced genomic scaffold CY34scaffold_555, whole genome shotgun sequence n=1 Tax=Suillus luteus UH-Slu-Lm8-n1 TaxID=930992 RepID=A0A0C9ZBM8_9AGAM|nr:hypothetical protein CY34DRAFT_17381 [Suillus luteus UH-Slu-Lm8-n1]